MSLVMGDIFVLVFGVVAVGFFGFFVAVAVVIWRVITFMVRRTLQVGTRRYPRMKQRDKTLVRACERAGCGHLNAGDARFCARCGQRLNAWSRVDNYG